MSPALNKVNGLDWAPADLQKKFSETWIHAKLVKNGATVHKGTVYIRTLPWNLDTGGEGALLRYAGKEEAFPYSGIQVIDDRPDPCITNCGYAAYLFTYNPARQWKRGFGPHNCFAYVSGLGSPSLVHNHGWTVALADRIADPDHMPIKLAMEWFKANPQGTGRAINNSYWLLKEGEAIKLYRHKAFMGSFIGKRFFGNAGVEIFKEELRTELPLLREAYGYN